MPTNPATRTHFFSRLKPRNSANIGRVSLVGAGPGDADLLTVKALRTLQQADVIFYDRLVSEDIRALFPIRTPAIYVGKAKDRHSIPQQDLNSLLVETAQLGLHVCRLKGGDAFVFGRGGEEMLELKSAGIAVDVVPGITAGAGATAYAGIPLTHRGIAQGVSFVTAQGEKELLINWSSLAHSGHTLVFYMGLGSASSIARELQNAGLSACTPAAIIEKGCSAQQRVFTESLSKLPGLVERHSIESPALIVVGEVVRLREQLQWLDQIASPELEEIYPEVATSVTGTVVSSISRSSNKNSLWKKLSA
ncbi:uroporphyrinogen-III C-methyltransferase [Gilvimarinus polysaccharolyticus]|uniref:uroporphyrinogen-III C-methyltransferase n=1 Tax=Gilvimarinus polysaccharolyticus TaxID=863921 RepID=UPI000A04BA48|nr:uroporphyrinogen-III C-methyltransferase [Gilvimarinus polysaccharolyticus]